MKIYDGDMEIIVNRAWEDASASQDFKERLRNRLIFRHVQTRNEHKIMPRILFVFSGIVVCALIVYGLWIPTTLDF